MTCILSYSVTLTCNLSFNLPLDSIAKRFTATIQVVKLGLGDRVVYVNGRNFEFSILEHLVQVVDSSSGLLGQTLRFKN